MDRAEIISTFTTLQRSFVAGLQRLDPQIRVREDAWGRIDHKTDDAGGGQSIVLERGAIFEKAGVNFSDVRGFLPKELAKALLHVDAEPAFSATGTSIVIHPYSPLVPTVHLNLRYFEVEGASWFGGGTDLTPYYLFEEDAQSFHRGLKSICDRHHAEHYPRFKKWCDDYFYLPHRAEARGIGGVFFDYLGREAVEPAATFFPFVRSMAAGFEPLYLEIVARRKDEPFTEAQKQFQLMRRGRYVEFNLLYDRGTSFGLKSNGRTESILMSLPPQVRWEYCFEPSEGSREAALIATLKNPRSWV